MSCVLLNLNVKSGKMLNVFFKKEQKIELKVSVCMCELFTLLIYEMQFSVAKNSHGC